MTSGCRAAAAAMPFAPSAASPLVVVAMLATAAGAHAQHDGAVPSPPELLARLRDPALTLDAAKALAPQVPTLPIALRLQASDVLRNVFLARQGRHAAACRDAAKEIAVAVAKGTTKSGAKRTAESADTLRAQALAISRRDDLTKEMVQRDVDPIVAQLEELLWPTRDALLERAPRLADTLAALQAARAELPQYFELYAGTLAGLDMHEDAQKHFVKHPPPPPPPSVATLDDEWTVWTLLAMPLSARDRKVLETNETLRATGDAQELAGTTALNRLRWLLGLPLLRIDEKLTLAARDHSADMSMLGFFAHESPVPGKRTPGDRAARFGTSGGAENIANGHDTGPSAIRGWWYSPGHHRNMLGGHSRVGLGRSAQLWTQMFGG